MNRRYSSTFKQGGKGFKRPRLGDLKRPENRVGFGLKRSQTATLRQQPIGRGKGRIKSRPDPKLVAWSREVRERDGGQCQFPGGCTTGDTRIDPHHKAKRSQRRDLKYAVSNGLCLCRTHHDWTDDNHDEAVRLGLLNIESRELAQKLKAA